MRKPLPPLNSLKPDTPLRLAVAAALAFPDGSITESSLRKACTRRELEHEILRGKYHTTLAAINEWRARCRVQPKGLADGFARKSATRTARSASARSESSETDHARSARAALQKILKAPSGRSANTSPASISPTVGANVVQIRSSSPTR
jgi:hypothetical protein